MAAACILVLAAIAAATPSPPPRPLPARISAPDGVQRAAIPPRAAPRAAGDLPRLSSGYRAARISLRWQAADAYGAGSVASIERRREVLQRSGDDGTRPRRARRTMELAELADPR